MQTIAFMVAYLACAGHGRRVQTRSDGLPSASHLEELEDTARRSRPLKSLAGVLLSLDHPARTAWQLTSSGRHVAARSLTSKQARPCSVAQRVATWSPKRAARSDVSMQADDAALEALLAGPASALIKQLTTDSRLDVPSSSVPRVLDAVCKYAQSSDEEQPELQRKVQRLYASLKQRGRLRAFGSCSDALMPLQRNMGVAEQTKVTGFAPEAFVSKNFLGSSLELVTWSAGFWTVLFGGAVLGIDPLITSPAIAVALCADRFALDRAISLSIRRTLRFGGKETAIKREAGRLLIAYLLGNPVIACSLDGLSKGTTIYNPDLLEGQASGVIKRKTLEKYSIVMMSGIASEVLATGKTNSGEVDEETLITALRKDQWDVSQIQNQARWGVSQALLLLKEHQAAWDAASKALQEGASVGRVIMAIEDALSVNELLPSAARAVVAPPEPTFGQQSSPVSAAPAPVPAPAPAARLPQSSQEVDKRLEEVETRLKLIDAKLSGTISDEEMQKQLNEIKVKAEARAEDAAKPLETDQAKPLTKEEEMAEVDAKLEAVKKRLAELEQSEE